MKKYSIFFILVVAVLILAGCGPQPSLDIVKEGGLSVVNEPADSQNTGIANPASVYCENNNGKLEIRTSTDGSQTGYCVFTGGKECEEWAFMRGECTEATAKFKPEAKNIDVEMQGFVFNPSVVTISVGDTVTWNNRDKAYHDVVIKDLVTSESFGRDQKWSYTFTKVGEYDYICSLHPEMTGKIIVK
ncbi:MAG: DUF333 domain-containing protein [Patescibacteria group bacterium]|jgi:plastocyanin